MRMLDIFRPTKTQLQILALISAAPTPTVAGDSVSVGTNMVASRKIMERLGLVIFTKFGEAELTPAGIKLAVEENVIDEASQLTQRGEQLLTTLPTTN